MVEKTAGSEPQPGAASRAPWVSIALFLLTVTGVGICLALAGVLLFPITGAIAVAVVLRTPLQLLRRRMGETWAANLLLGIFCLAIVLPGFFLVRSLVGEAMHAVNYVQTGAAARDLHQLQSQHPQIGARVQVAVDHLAPDQVGRQVAGQAALWLGRGLQKLATGLTEVVLLLFFLYFLLRDQERARSALAALVPLDGEETETFLSRLGDLIYAVFAGRFVIAGIQGALAGAAYALLGVPGALLWSVVTAICCLVPAFGAFLAWIPIALYLGLAASWTKALILALWGGLVVGNIDNVLYPVLVGKRTNLHTAVIFVAIFGGVALMGISGFVIGPVVVAATMLLLESWKRRRGLAAQLSSTG